MRRLLGSTLRAAGFLIATFVLLEGALALWLACPLLPSGNLAHRLYFRDIVLPQEDPHCARFDPELLYVLRPGVCHFDTREFSTEIRVNSGGFRDDEASLHAPPIIALGDSSTMGWGVAEEQAYPALLEQRLGVRVLNAGVPSYGTRREIQSLNRMDTSALSILIVQHDVNDHAENKAFAKVGLPAPDPELYRRAVASNGVDSRYWLGKYSWIALLSAFGRIREVELADPHKVKSEVRMFLYALRHASSVDLSRVHVITFATEPENGTFGPVFVKALNRFSAANPHPGWIGHLTAVDVSDLIGPGTRIRLDGHIGPEAHRRIAERLATLIAPELARLSHAAAARP